MRPDGKASVRHQHDLLSRHAQAHMLTMHWNLQLAHTSLSITPEQCGTSGENSSQDLQEQDTQGACASHCSKPQDDRIDRVCKHACGKADANCGPAQWAANETPVQDLKDLCNFACAVLTAISHSVGQD